VICFAGTYEDDHECSKLFDDKADDIQEYSYKIAAWGAALIVIILAGHSVMNAGLGTASASLCKHH